MTVLLLLRMFCLLLSALNSRQLLLMRRISCIEFDSQKLLIRRTHPFQPSTLVMVIGLLPWTRYSKRLHFVIRLMTSTLPEKDGVGRSAIVVEVCVRRG